MGNLAVERVGLDWSGCLLSPCFGSDIERAGELVVKPSSPESGHHTRTSVEDVDHA